MPVSTTHAVVGGVLGMTVAGAGPSCVLWLYPGLLQIVASWVISPILAGLISGILDILIRRVVLDARTPLRRALFTLPIATGLTIGSVLCTSTLAPSPPFPHPLASHPGGTGPDGAGAIVWCALPPRHGPSKEQID